MKFVFCYAKIARFLYTKPFYLSNFREYKVLLSDVFSEEGEKVVNFSLVNMSQTFENAIKKYNLSVNSIISFKCKLSPPKERTDYMTWCDSDSWLYSAPYENYILRHVKDVIPIAALPNNINIPRDYDESKIDAYLKRYESDPDDE